MNADLKTAGRISLVFPAVMLLACVWGVSSALAGEQLRTETVKFQDLNVDTPAGVEALYGRIHAAARRVCSQSDPIARAGAIACAKRAEADAIKKVNLPQLTTFYQMKTGDQAQTLSANR